MSPWTHLALAALAFLASHLLPMLARDRLAAALGRTGYLVAYSALSLAVLACLIAAANAAPRLTLWDPQPGTRWLVNLAMPAAILLMVCAGRTPMRAQGAVARVTAHPLMTALLLWSLAHLAANGDLAHVLLFGGFAALAAAGIAASERRAPSGGPVWPRLWRLRPRPAQLALAAAIWALLWWGHQPVIGVTPSP